MSVNHGIYIYENDTAIKTPVDAVGALVVIGTAPFQNAAHSAGAGNPVLCYSAEEAIDKLGYSSDFANYSICEMMYLQKYAFPVSPVVYIGISNYLRTTRPEQTSTVTVEGATADVTKDIGIQDKSTVLVYQGAKASSGTRLQINRDYTVSVDYETDHVIVTLIVGGDSIISTAEGAASVYIYYKIPGYNTKTQIASTAVSYAAKIQDIYPKFGVIPSIIICPFFSKLPSVGAALIANAANIDGIFKAITILDIDSTEHGAQVYSNVKTAKDAAGYTSPYCIPVWPSCKMADNKVLAMSAVAGALMAYLDAQNRGIPYRTFSNRMINQTGAGMVGICLENGTEVILSQDQANHVNAGGVTTAINMNGWRMWGSYTGAYPGDNDVKNMWAPVRRMFNWHGNIFIQTYFSKVDDPLNYVLIESIVDSENIRAQAYAPDVWAGAEIEFLESDNPVTDLIAGKITFHQRIAPYTPAQEIDNILSYDTDMLLSALTGLE